ncbi:hypothetical protein L6452_40074 [Arctium lappa]|uniref:Uncharacterized protein n=1 Tax=Arctium lappa TaxID=4217 RepID=A0ACB8XKD6_ARCLA|nr:hypothetical protein L6452_40074 [Arctium lappa]
MPFCIEVGYFDTMKEIKEKVAKYHGIPVYEQTLIFKDKTLPDDLNIHNSDIFDRSRIQLHINNNTTEKVIVKKEEEITPCCSNNNSQQKNKKSMMMIKLMLKSSTSLGGGGGGVTSTIEMDMNDSVLKLKEKMNELMELGGSICRIHANGIELHDDHKTLHECQLVNVMSKCGKKITLEMNPLNNVGELRKELHKVIRNNNNQAGSSSFRLPEDGYFFIYKQNVMEEDQSFRWHRVAQGDTIEIFNGCVTGGGS